MAATPRWGGLRVEPYDPDARDADGDGIVQEGTAWERPVGMHLLDELGRAIVRGSTSNSPNRGLQYVDSNGKPATYSPTWSKFVSATGEVIPEKKRKGTGLARLGIPSLKDRGHRSVLDIRKSAIADEARASAAAALVEDVPTPKSQRIPGTLALPDGVAPAPRKPLLRRLFPGIHARNKTVESSAQNPLNAWKSREERVLAAHGPIDSVDHAVAALNKSFPNLITPFTGTRADEWQTKDPSRLTPHERGWVIGLLDLAEQDPDIAKAMGRLDHKAHLKGTEGAEQPLATAAIHGTVHPNGVAFHYALQFCTADDSSMEKHLPFANPDGRAATLLKQLRGEIPFDDPLAVYANDPAKRAQIKDRLTMLNWQFKNEIEQGVTSVEELWAHEELDGILHEARFNSHSLTSSYASLFNAGEIDKDAYVMLQASTVADHEWSHLRDYRARIKDGSGIDISDDPNALWQGYQPGRMVNPFGTDVFDGNFQPSREYQEIMLDPDLFHPEQIAQMRKAHQKARNKHLSDVKKSVERNDHSQSFWNELSGGSAARDLDDLDPLMKTLFAQAIGDISDYGNTNIMETAAELGAAMSNKEMLLDYLEAYSYKHEYLAFSREEIAAALDQFEDWMLGKTSAPTRPPHAVFDDAELPSERKLQKTSEVFARLEERVKDSAYLRGRVWTQTLAHAQKQASAVESDPYGHTYELTESSGWAGYAQIPQYFETRYKSIEIELVTLRRQLESYENLRKEYERDGRLDGRIVPGSEIRNAGDIVVQTEVQKALIAQFERQQATLKSRVEDFMSGRSSVKGIFPTWASERIKAVAATDRVQSTTGYFIPAVDRVGVDYDADGKNFLIPLCTGLNSSVDPVATALLGNADESPTGYEIKSLPFQRRLRMEPYDPDAQDGDGDGIVQDGTPWERPVGTFVLSESGKHFAKGTQLNRRSSGMRIVDKNGNDVAYVPKRRSARKVGLERINSAITRRKPQKQPIIAPPKKVSSPLGQIGHPTLREMGHADLDDFMDPPPPPEDMPVPEVIPALQGIDEATKDAVEHIRVAAPDAFPDLPSAYEWPPTLPVGVDEIADEFSAWDDTMRMETRIESSLRAAAEDLVDRLSKFYEFDISEDDAVQLLIIALGRTPEEFSTRSISGGMDFSADYALTGLAQAMAQQADDRASEFVKVIQESGQLKINTTVEDLIGVIESGRYKSQFETGTSAGHFSPTLRALWENEFLLQPEDLPDNLRPVYGSVVVPDLGAKDGRSGIESQYGGVRILLHDSAKDRALFTIGDSLHTDALPHPLIGDPPDFPLETYSNSSQTTELKYLLLTALRDMNDEDGRTLELFLESLGFDVEEAMSEGEIMQQVYAALLLINDWGAPSGIRDTPWGRSYIEAQILGGVSLYDIAEIVFPTSAEFDYEGDPNFRAMLKLLDELKIPYSFDDNKAG